VHHVRLERRAGGVVGGEHHVGALAGALQRLHGDGREDQQHQGAGRHEGGQLHAERTVGPQAARHRLSSERGG
jgi:hypothetical protein